MLRWMGVLLPFVGVALGLLSCKEKANPHSSTPTKSKSLAASLDKSSEQDWSAPSDGEIEQVVNRLLRLERIWLRDFGFSEEDDPVYELMVGHREFDLNLTDGERKALLGDVFRAEKENNDHPAFNFVPHLVRNWAANDVETVIAFLQENASENWQEELRGEIRLGQALGGEPEAALLAYQEELKEGFRDPYEVKLLIIEEWARENERRVWDYLLETGQGDRGETVAFVKGLPNAQDWQVIAEQLKPYFDDKPIGEVPLTWLAVRWMLDDFEAGKDFYDSLSVETKMDRDFELMTILGELYADQAEKPERVDSLFENLMRSDLNEIAAFGYGAGIVKGNRVTYDLRMIDLVFNKNQFEDSSSIALFMMKQATLPQTKGVVFDEVERRKFFNNLRQVLPSSNLKGKAVRIAALFSKGELEEVVRKFENLEREPPPASPPPPVMKTE